MRTTIELLEYKKGLHAGVGCGVLMLLIICTLPSLSLNEDKHYCLTKTAIAYHYHLF